MVLYVKVFVLKLIINPGEFFWMIGMFIKKYIFFLCMFLLPLVVHAQSGLAFYHTDEMLFRSNFNPAFFTSNEKFTFSALPVAGGTMSLNDKDALTNVTDLLFHDDVNDTMKDIFKRMVNKKIYYQHGEMSLLNFGYHSKYGSFNFVIKDQVRLMLDFQGELSRFLMNKENLRVIFNQSQTFPTEAIHFREYSIGYSKEIIRKRLSVGLRAKLLFGKSFLSSNASATTNGSINDYFVISSGSINVSLPAERIENPLGGFQKLDPLANGTILDYMINTGNPGFAFDLGLKYAVTPDIEISASIVDFGKINWKTDLHSLELNTRYDLDPGDALTNTINGIEFLTKTRNDISFEDDISKIFDISTANDASFDGALPLTLYLGLHYKINDQVNVGLVDRYVKFGDLTYNSLAANVNYKLSDRFTAVSGLGIYGDSYLNIPFGFLYKWHSGQAYLTIENTASIVLSSISDFQGFSAGAVFYLFRPKMKYERFDNLPFYKHKTKKRKDDNGLMFKGYEKK